MLNSRDGYPPRLTTALNLSHLPVLDGLRGIAAIAVVLYHFDENLFPTGGHGVLIFFVLSGFLITWLMCGEVERTGTVSLRRFYARRSLRIFPAFYVYWLLATAYLLGIGQMLSGRAVPWAQAISSFFYVGNYYQGLNHYPASVYSHTWSLGVEEQFYLLWPAVFLGMLSLEPKRRARWVVLMLIGFWALRWGLHFGGIPEEYIYTSFETRADQLLVGCLLAVVLRAGLCPRLVTKVASIPPIVTLTLFVLSIAIAGHWGADYRNTIGFTADPILFAALILQLFSTRSHYAVRWLDSGPLRFLGAISYSIYLYQQLLLYPVQRLLPESLPTVVRFGLAVGAVIVAAWLSARIVEAPFNRLKARFAA